LCVNLDFQDIPPLICRSSYSKSGGIPKVPLLRRGAVSGTDPS
jgi:hypothetical protein